MRLLLIEDYAPLRKTLSIGLRKAGFAVDAAGDGDEGFWYAQGNEYDVILLDLLLPGRDGLSILRELRSQGKQTHVLILTARDRVADRVEGLNCGADDYLTKPFAFDELLARINALIRRGYGHKDPEVRVGPLRIHPATGRAWRAKEELKLTGREYSLLEYLAMRAGEVVSRADIWEHVYDFHSTATSNVVDVYVNYLRKKLDRPGDESLIRTVRGRGYCLGDPQC